MNDYVAPLVTLFEQHANPEQAVPMANYMRDQFPFLGLKSPQRSALFKQFMTEFGLPKPAELEEIVWELWQLPEREYQYSAQDLLHRMRKHVSPEYVLLLERLITTKSWWDTIDGLASHAVGGLFTHYPNVRDDTVARWRSSDNFWLHRTTLLFQLGYKDKTDEALLFSLIEENLDSKEFFIQKAIGWILREYSKTAPNVVQDYVAKTALAPLSEREALKWMKNKGML
jgi:3-methyladenine DNA glycosylase AlkD